MAPADHSRDSQMYWTCCCCGIHHRTDLLLKTSKPCAVNKFTLAAARLQKFLTGKTENWILVFDNMDDKNELYLSRSELRFEWTDSIESNYLQFASTDKEVLRWNSLGVSRQSSHRTLKIPTSRSSNSYPTCHLALRSTPDPMATERFSLMSLACTLFIRERGQNLVDLARERRQTNGREFSGTTQTMDWTLLSLAILYTLSTTFYHYLHSRNGHTRQNSFLSAGISLGILHNTLLHGTNIISLLLCFSPGWIFGSLVLSSWWHRSFAKGPDFYVYANDKEFTSSKETTSDSQGEYKDDKTENLS